MDSVRLLYVPVLLVILQVVSAQQAYEAKYNLDCSNTQDINYGYKCNGEAKSCQAYAVYRSQTGYQTLANISTLLNSNQSQMATINNSSQNQILDIDKAVIVPVDCSCAGSYSQANASYIIQPDDSYFKVANNTYQGLSTCQALQQQNSVAATALQIGMNISVPLRCACPTKTQTGNGTKYLLSYTVRFGDSLAAIGKLYGATAQEIMDANGLTADDDTILPYTTLLVPLTTAPTSSPQSSPSPPPPPPPTSTSTPTGGGGSKTGEHIGIGVGVAAGVLAAALVAGACIVRRRKKKRQQLPEKVLNSIPSPRKAKNPDLLAGMADMGHILPQYKFEDLQSATDNFSASNRITASVYRGLLGIDAAPVAIKQMTGDVSQELNILKTLNHFNLVRLLGICKSEGRFYLIYEYAEHGSLDELLHGPEFETWTSRGSSISSSICLSWKQRIQIALDVVNGLHYLHNYANPPYVHKDIKSSNILLDSNYRAKIANFGLAKSAEDYALTRHVVGTKGYMAPEYLSSGLVTPKLDIFSFGVVLLELLSGRGPVLEDNNGDVQEHLLSTEIGSVVESSNPEESLKGFMDSSLRDACPMDMALAVAQLAAECVDQDLNRRPATMDIVLSLSKWHSAMLDSDSFESENLMPGR
ncbi:protein LYK5 [Cryptomeria japonica]|uniref:protein LYK5 n=1 Tax=Cryptomeria japonica TaxID=3369 RepID=UPI0027DA796F|nr:protein LYK5 [Cryptomeria japonica]XP_059076026.1 protein LYK5 [Cryptomeria japonica]